MSAGKEEEASGNIEEKKIVEKMCTYRQNHKDSTGSVYADKNGRF